MVRLRLRYDEACQQVTKLQEQLACIEDQIIPGQNESDKDRYDFYLHAQETEFCLKFFV